MANNHPDDRDPRPYVKPPPLFWLMVLFMALCLWMMFGTGCAKREAREVRRPIEFAPVNPDVAAVTTRVTQARDSNVKATDSATRAVQIVEKIIVAPGQELELAKLKWELKTTVDELKITAQSLSTTQTQVSTLAVEVENSKRWGIEQQNLYFAEYEGRQVDRLASRREKAERGFLINCLSISLTGIALLIAIPVVIKLSKIAGAFAFFAAIAMYLAVVAIAYWFSWTIIEWALRILVVMT